ncbi:MAG: hypothetical protein HYY06_01795 [Deltaproteobacteria bacterium]|nr:hypothetical protein [Deltaproteobacteria bacterium]
MSPSSSGSARGLLCFFFLVSVASACAGGGSEQDTVPCEVDLDCDRRSICDPELGICVPAPDAGGPGVDAGDDEGGGLCSECERNADCAEPGAICLRAELGPRFCGRLCGDGIPACPEGYDCAEVTDFDGDRAGSQCVPTNGDCSCLPERDGASRSCVVENDWGTCEGLQRCFADSGWGACQAPDPAAETCDGQDNDCDGAVDEEEDLNLGTCGLGVCEAPEECVDAPDGATLECEPGPQRLDDDTDCNDEDDDCDGLVDEAYVPFTCGLGVCARDSTCKKGGTEICVAGQAIAEWDDTCNGLDEDCSGEDDEDYAGGSCGVGICVRPETCVGGEPVCVPGDPEPDDAPELGFEDSNCDGIDGDLEDGVFVDWITGDDGNDGSIDFPMATISAGIDEADISGKHVYISEGTYSESIALAPGVGLYGGYSAENGWSRSVGNVVEISGGATAVYGSGIDEDTELQLLTIRSADASIAGGSSYGVFLANSSGVLLTRVTVRAGNGRDGTNGADGDDGDDGDPGSDGNPGCENASFEALECWDPDSCDRPAGGAGGASTCGRTGGAGGWPGLAGSDGQDGRPSEDGTPGGPGGSGGGYGDGTNGTSGDGGDDGTSGTGGLTFGTVNLAGYGTANGTSGTNGTSGHGGGGGGGGGGGDSYCDSYGSSGGGGGGGGCRGMLGTRGFGGGGSFAVYLWASTVDAVDCDFRTGSGGDGGRGGTGGDGGAGGDYGEGGPYGGPGGDEQDDGGMGARGGTGGDGGRGGHGGGGGGGPSIGIECGNGSAIATDIGNGFTLGTAGAGGQSSGNDGDDGERANRDGC